MLEGICVGVGWLFFVINARTRFVNRLMKGNELNPLNMKVIEKVPPMMVR